jgi:hypothetical protein
MWDKPSAEITDLKSKCENLLEKYESEIEDWYNEGEKVSLKEYLCKGLALKGKDATCLDEKLALEDTSSLPSTMKDKGETEVGKDKKRNKKEL